MSVSSSFTLRPQSSSAGSTYVNGAGKQPNVLRRSLHLFNQHQARRPSDKFSSQTVTQRSKLTTLQTSDSLAEDSKKAGTILVHSYSPFETLDERKIGKGPITPLNPDEHQAWRKQQQARHALNMKKTLQPNSSSRTSRCENANGVAHVKSKLSHPLKDQGQERKGREQEWYPKLVINASNSIRATPFEPLVSHRNLNGGTLKPFLDVSNQLQNPAGDTDVTWKRRYQRAELARCDARKQLLGVLEENRQLKIQLISQKADRLSSLQRPDGSSAGFPNTDMDTRIRLENEQETQATKVDREQQSAAKAREDNELYPDGIATGIEDSQIDPTTTTAPEKQNEGRPCSAQDQPLSSTDQVDGQVVSEIEAQGIDPLLNGPQTLKDGCNPIVAEMEESSLSTSGKKSVVGPEGLANTCRSVHGVTGVERNANSDTKIELAQETSIGLRPRQESQQSTSQSLCSQKMEPPKKHLPTRKTDLKSSFINIQRGSSHIKTSPIFDARVCGTLSPTFQDTSTEAEADFGCKYDHTKTPVEDSSAEGSVLLACWDPTPVVDSSDCTNASSPKKRRLSFTGAEVESAPQTDGFAEANNNTTLTESGDVQETAVQAHESPFSPYQGQEGGNCSVEILVGEGNSLTELDVSAITTSSPTPRKLDAQGTTSLAKEEQQEIDLAEAEELPSDSRVSYSLGSQLPYVATAGSWKSRASLNAPFNGKAEIEKAAGKEVQSMKKKASRKRKSQEAVDARDNKIMREHSRQTKYSPREIIVPDHRDADALRASPTGSETEQIPDDAECEVDIFADNYTETMTSVTTQHNTKATHLSSRVTRSKSRKDSKAKTVAAATTTPSDAGSTSVASCREMSKQASSPTLPAKNQPPTGSTQKMTRGLNDAMELDLSAILHDDSDDEMQVEINGPKPASECKMIKAEEISDEPKDEGKPRRCTRLRKQEVQNDDAPSKQVGGTVTSSKDENLLHMKAEDTDGDPSASSLALGAVHKKRTRRRRGTLVTSIQAPALKKKRKNGKR